MNNLSDYVVFKDQSLKARYQNRKIPMSTLIEAYLDDKVDINGDIMALLERRDLFVKYWLTPNHFKFFFTNFIPEVAIHSKKQDKRIVREHYDRGNDFFSAFLGDRMVYTSGFFENADQTLEEGQDQKMSLVCEKLQVKKGERMLDIGCGWGTLAMHAAKHFGADATGITISENQTEFGNDRMRKVGVSDHARVLCLDYRDIPRGKYDKISSLEMVEHVGIKNLGKFLKQVYGLLSDDGMFLLQFTGLRRGMKPEDLIWGLFMNKYIFPGADASLPLGPMIQAMEKAGFEIHSVENVSPHYAYTIKKWHENWQSNKAQVLATYGERWYRLWHVFLGWSTLIAFQGSAACFQIVANKNLNRFDRTRFVGGTTFGERAVLRVDGRKKTAAA